MHLCFGTAIIMESPGIFPLLCWKSLSVKQQWPHLLLIWSWATNSLLFYFYESYYTRYIIYGKSHCLFITVCV